MKSCCEAKATELAELRAKQAGVLRTVLGVNLVMFAIEVVFGLVSGSSAVLADSLDMLGDASVYGFSLYVLHRAAALRAKAAMLKGAIMLGSGCVVAFEVLRRAFVAGAPAAGLMGGVGVLALAANGFCAYLLFRHRDDDANLRSTWLCSRNDVIANLGVITAAILVQALGSRWPDTAVGSVIAILFLSSAISVFRDATVELNAIRGRPS